MKVKELLNLLSGANPEAKVLIADNGSILPTGPAQDSVDYNIDNDTDEFFLVTEEYE